MEIKRILVPHDGNQMSDKAVLYASKLAKALNTEIMLLYVVEEIEVPATLLLGNDRVLIARARRDIQRELEQNWNRFICAGKGKEPFSRKDRRINRHQDRRCCRTNSEIC